jgi:cytochrome c oxidase subunit 4
VSDLETPIQHELGDHLKDPGEAVEHEHPSAKEYIRIALILAVLTAIEVGISYTDISHSILIPALFLLAGVKFVLVVLWFMHLKFDDRRYARFFVMGLAGAVTLYLIVLITFRAFLN